MMFQKAASSAKSASRASGECAASSAAVWVPVATAITLAPITRAQAMSCGVSPMIHVRVGGKWTPVWS